MANGNTNSNFHSSGLRQKVDQLMDILWAGGVNNPMDSIEQISYLLFLRLLTEDDERLARLDKKYAKRFSGKFSRYAWGNFVTLTGDQLFDAVRAAIESLYELPGLSETGKLLFNRATLKIYDRPTLRAVIQAIQEMDLASHDGHDLKGDMYEYLLSKLALSGTNGQFRTPRHIIQMIVSLVDPQPGRRICDPACGTAGFLIAAYQHILRNHTSKATLAKGIVDGQQLEPRQWKFLEERAFTGYDNDANMVKIAILNLYLHALAKAHIELYNPLTDSRHYGESFDVILANPPLRRKNSKRKHPRRHQPADTRYRIALREMVHRSPHAGWTRRCHCAGRGAVRRQQGGQESSRTVAHRMRPPSRRQYALRLLQALLRREHRRVDF